MTTRLAIDNVGLIHGEGRTAVAALAEVTLHVAAGEMVAVMGPSGSGKTTLLSLAGGLDFPTSGTVSVEGSDPGALSVTELAELRRRRIGYVFQQFNLIDGLTAAENVALPLERPVAPRGPTGGGAGRRRRLPPPGSPEPAASPGAVVWRATGGERPRCAILLRLMPHMAGPA